MPSLSARLRRRASSYGSENSEELVERDPEVFVLGYGYDGKETFEQAQRKLLAIPGISDTKAARDGRIIGVPAAKSEPDP
ncbi:MAG TPA: hypothetical protein VGO80_07980 [Solirubrobacteraceae bacterium]|nr:hypothetical protein [Solirubrobacteraceae bacterium]